MSSDTFTIFSGKYEVNTDVFIGNNFWNSFKWTSNIWFNKYPATMVLISHQSSFAYNIIQFSIDVGSIPS